ncbi:MAG TPA: hypothetical protein VHR88_08080 [Solirubrobacteraceae bacterium]|nr:hypothetical protein [Solirubrobacteraceae bacterium]
MNQSYGVTDVQLVGHSDGGIWSRSAITQYGNFPGVTVTSLTTLGSPHEGSFVADLALGIDGLDCSSPTNPYLRLLCEGVQQVEQLISKELGPIALQELTSTFMESWNTTQSIGACPTTVVAGTYVSVPYIGSLIPQYYNPSDGVVGQSSALGTPSTALDLQPIPAPDLPGLINGGTFPVVHSPSLSFITTANLLNQASVSSVVQTAVAAGRNGSACAQSPASAGPGVGSGAGAGSGSGVAGAASGSGGAGAASRAGVGGEPPPPLSTNMALDPVSLVGDVAADRLPAPRRGDVVIAPRGVRAKCGRRVYVDRSSPGFKRAVLAPVPPCGRPLSVTGGRALELRRDRAHPVDLRVDGNKVRVRVRHGPVRKLETQVSTGGAYHRLRLDRRGRGTLPADDNGTRVRVLLTVGRGGGPRETAVAVLAR